jgi:hypothetical protein
MPVKDNNPKVPGCQPHQYDTWMNLSDEFAEMNEYDIYLRTGKHVTIVLLKLNR